MNQEEFRAKQSIAEVSAKINEFKAKRESAKAETKSQYDEVLNDLESKKADLEAKYDDYNFTEFLGLRLLYQNIYDSSPLVPIDKLYHDVNFGVTISF